jgi:hypothetical protein
VLNVKALGGTEKILEVMELRLAKNNTLDFKA